MISKLLSPLLILLLWLTSGNILQAGKLSFSNGRFSVEIPAGWKKSSLKEESSALLQFDAPGGSGSFSTYQLPVVKERKADLEGTLKARIRAFEKAGLKLSAKVQSQKQENFDGKPAIFGVVPVEATAQGMVVRFTYYLVLIDAKDSVILMQAALPRPLTPELQKDALSIIQSFREKSPGF